MQAFNVIVPQIRAFPGVICVLHALQAIQRYMPCLFAKSSTLCFSVWLTHLDALSWDWEDCRDVAHLMPQSRQEHLRIMEDAPLKSPSKEDSICSSDNRWNFIVLTPVISGLLQWTTAFTCQLTRWSRSHSSSDALVILKAANSASCFKGLRKSFSLLWPLPPVIPR